jgi:hypothetical protein
VGAQSAALLASGAPLGEPARFTTAVTTVLTGPAGYDLDRVARAHGGCGLAPTAYVDGVLTTVLPDGTGARVRPDLSVELSGPGDLGVLRRVLDLDTDPSELWAVCDPWVREQGAGRQLRAATAFEALVQALAATNTSYRGTQAMLRELADDGPLPAADQVVGRELRRWGYRRSALDSLARAVAEGLTDSWDRLDDEELLARIQRLQGFGPFAAASVLPLLGRPRPLVLDGWLAQQVPDPTSYAVLGRWAGTAMWLDVSRSWWGPRP